MMALKTYALAMVATLGFSGGVMAQSNLIVPGPASAPAASAAPSAAAQADYSDPRKAVASFMKANDEPAMREAIVVTPASKAAVDAFLGVMVATINLQKEAQAQYGPAAAPYFTKATDAQIQARLKTVATAPMEVHGDRATVALPADEAARQSAGTIKLRKVGSDWKIEAETLFGIDVSPADVTARRIKEADAIRGVTDDMIKEIAARKYAAAGDAYQAYFLRSNDAVKAARGAMPAATQSK